MCKKDCDQYNDTVRWIGEELEKQIVSPLSCLLSNVSMEHIETSMFSPASLYTATWAIFKAQDYFSAVAASYRDPSVIALSFAWEVPPYGWQKINGDGSCVARNHAGGLILGKGHYLGLGTNNMAELQGMNAALPTALQNRDLKYIIETDSFIKLWTCMTICSHLLLIAQLFWIYVTAKSGL